jgi:alpha-1,6-mannosyltransferase
LQASSLHRRINALGAAGLSAYLVMAALSYLQTPALWEKEDTPHADAFFSELYGLQAVEAIRGFFASKMAIITWHWVPLGVATAALAGVLLVVSLHARQLDDRAAKLLVRWALAFAAACFFAFPVFTQDFWLSAAWGRMTTAGVNPYYNLFTPESFDGLPLDHFPMVMSYGPLWALMSAAIMTVTFGSVWAAALLFKAVIAGAWCGSLLLIARILRDSSPVARCMGLAVFGWTPLSVHQSIAEGHNDIVMVFPAVLWLALLLRRHWSGPFALGASVLIKYITAPLLLVDALVNLRLYGMTLRRYVLHLIPAGFAGLAILAIFYRSPSFFDGLRLISTWHFLQPTDAVAALQYLLGISLPLADFAVVALFPLVAVYQIYLFWRMPTAEGAFKVSLVVVASVSFSAINHIWPWYIIWTLALAALVPYWWLSQFIVGLAVMAPFTVAVWWVPEFEPHKGLTAVMLYAGASAWAAVSVYARKALARRARAARATVPALPYPAALPGAARSAWEEGEAPLVQPAPGE